jgi:hypothetical protein
MPDAIPMPFPLAWPEGVERTKTRIDSRFKATLASALSNVEGSLFKFGRESGKAISNIVRSSNVTLGVPKPVDPGVAVWFTWEDELRCIAVDRYRKVEENLQAIHHILEARCTELRHGGLIIVRQTFRNFVALPRPEVDWRGLLGFEQSNTLPTKEAVEEKFRAAAAKAHPDKPGGSEEKMTAVNAARAAALEAIGAK